MIAKHLSQIHIYHQGNTNQTGARQSANLLGGNVTANRLHKAGGT